MPENPVCPGKEVFFCRCQTRGRHTTYATIIAKGMGGHPVKDYGNIDISKKYCDFA